MILLNFSRLMTKYVFDMYCILPLPGFRHTQKGHIETPYAAGDHHKHLS